MASIDNEYYMQYDFMDCVLERVCASGIIVQPFEVNQRKAHCKNFNLLTYAVQIASVQVDMLGYSLLCIVQGMKYLHSCTMNSASCYCNLYLHNMV